MLFDIVRELNDRINELQNGGKPGRVYPKVFGATDGYNVQITFMDMVIWDSATWDYGSDERAEYDRIKLYCQKMIKTHITTLYSIQFTNQI